MCLFKGQVEDFIVETFFHILNGTGRGSPPSMTTTCYRELVSVLEVRIEPGDLYPRPLTPQSVTLPTLPRAGSDVYISYTNVNLNCTEWKFVIMMRRYGYRIGT